MRIKSVVATLLVACLAGTAVADLVDNFESYTQGVKANGVTFGPWTASVMSPGTCEVVSSPFADGGNNAFRVNGASDRYVRIQAVDSFPAVADDFKYTMDLNLKSVYGANGKFAQLYGNAGYVVSLGTQAVSTNNFYLTVSGAGGAMTTINSVYLSALANYSVEITSDLSGGTYDLLLTDNVSGDTVISLTDQALTSPSTSITRVYLGNLVRSVGTSAILTVDNVSLTNVPEPATMALLATGSLLFFRKRRS